MRAAVMRDWQLRVDDLPDPTPGPGQVLAKVLACGICGSDLHLLRHGEESRRLMNELNADRPPDPMQLTMFEPQRRHGDGSRVLLRGRRARLGLRQPEGRRRRRQPAGRVRSRRASPARVFERLQRRLRRADGPQRDAGDEGARRLERRDRGDDRTTRRRRPRRCQEQDHQQRERNRARLRPGRAGLHRRVEDARHRPDRRRRLLPQSAARSPNCSAPTSWSIHGSRRRSRRGDRPTGCARR